MIFEKTEHSAVSNQQSTKPGSLATLCRPNSKNGKTRLKLKRIEALKNGKKGLRLSYDCLVEWGFGFCFQQSAMGGGARG
jgi:hypothetical protein